MREQHIRFTIDSRLEDVPLLGILLNTVCAAANLCPEARSEVEVCVVEAVNNSIKHAYRNEAGHTVELEVRILPDRVTFDIFDTGKSADPKFIHGDHAKALEVSLDPQQLAESGRGLAIMQQYMDAMEYTAGPRNRLRLVKRLTAVAASQGAGQGKS